MQNRSVILASAAALLLIAAATTRTYHDAGLKAANWIESTAVHRPQGTAWPTDPKDPKSVNTSLYSGIPGPVLFFLEAYHDTGDKQFLDQARSGADSLLASIENEKSAGLYEGLAGIGFTLNETYKVTHDRKYRDGAVRCVQKIELEATRSPDGVSWGDSSDIISGSSGVGLFLIYAANELNDPSARDLAVQAARHLLALSEPSNGGLLWRMDSKFPRIMPNFSHGTAGVAYFLATVYQQTHDAKFLDAALAGAKYLTSIADTQGDQCLIYHDVPDNKNLYYLGWCHGPPGTARLFYRLYQITGVKTWLDWVKKSERSLLDSGIPEKQTPGFWNNVSLCCGSVAVAQFSLELYRVTKDPQYLAFAKHVTADLLAKSTAEGNGLKWIQAEHRVKPDLLIAQTGLMQGAAGIGMWLFHMDEFEHGKNALITLPDNPFSL